MYKFNIVILKIITTLNKQRTTVYSLLFVITVFQVFTSCTKESTRKHIENDSTPPGVIRDISVENFHGGAKISYEIPTDLDLLYVQAEYEIREGVKEEAQSSFYRKHLLLEGFGDTAKHEIRLYAVDRSGNKSKEVTAVIKPLLSPVQMAYSSLSFKEDFGGINVTYLNPTQADLVTTVMFKDQNEDWVVYDRNYTSTSDVDFSVRGLSTTTLEFGVFIKDKWNNYSDTLIQHVSPLKEVALDKRKFNILVLPTDAETDTWPIRTFWNDNSGGGNGFHTTGNTGLPAWITIDLGITSRLSRVRIWQVHDGREYSGGNVRQFQLWGSNDPDADGGWDNWTLLQDCEIIKPSGLPMGELSNEDVQQAADGHEFSIPGSAPSVRYIRLKVNSTFTITAGAITGSVWAREISLWGQN